MSVGVRQSAVPQASVTNSELLGKLWFLRSTGKFPRAVAEERHPSVEDRFRRAVAGKSNGAESRLAYLGHLIETRHGSMADAMATIAAGFAEREGATVLMRDQWQQARDAAARSAPTTGTTTRSLSH